MVCPKADCLICRCEIDNKKDSVLLEYNRIECPAQTLFFIICGSCSKNPEGINIEEINNRLKKELPEEIRELIKGSLEKFKTGKMEKIMDNEVRGRMIYYLK